MRLLLNRRRLMAGGLFTLIAFGSTAIFVVSTREARLPSYFQTIAQFRPSDQFVVDRHGEVLDQVRMDSHGRRLSWLRLGEISPALQTAVVASEDKSFATHDGVDFKSLASSAWRNLVHHSHSGGSTISMQLAAMLVGDKSLSSGHRSLRAKWRQIRLAWTLERTWTKSQILEAYLNLAHFRGELQGVQAASRFLFRKNAHGLDATESAILVSLLRAPNATWAQVATRACRQDSGDCDSIGKSISFASQHDQPDLSVASLAPHFAKHLSGSAGVWLESTLDAGIQKEALRLASEQMSLLRSQNVHDVAILVVENQTGDVVAYVGNSPEFSSARYVDGVQTRRQAGSTLKSFLYATAFEKRILTPNSLISDQPFEVDTGRGLYRPQNYDHIFRGTVNVRSALASSMNIPAVRTLQLLTPDIFVDFLGQLGFQKLNSGADYGDSIALGTADITLWELVRAYRVFANDGVYSDLHETRSVTTPLERRIFSTETAYRISDILSDREARSATFGLENPLATRFWSAVKTGTSKDMRDNWCVGYSSRYTVGVWVGNFSGDAMWDVSGITGAAPIWVSLMNSLHEHEPSVKPARPLSLNDDDKHVMPLKNSGFQKIISPTTGTITVWDPDIPRSRQKILFQSTSHQRSFKWLLNGHLVGRADRPFLWTPHAGKHRLALIGARGEKEDEVVFTVRR